MKVAKFFLNILIFFLVILLIFSMVSLGAYYGGYLKISFNTVINQVAGTGSMYPTFPKANILKGESPEKIVAEPEMKVYPDGVFLFGSRYYGHDLARGDIVAFENQKTEKLTTSLYGKNSGYVKRIVGLPGETIMLRDGEVYINEKILDEPYTYKAKSTFGDEFLNDCKKLKIPTNKYFVMGDNRKGSLDSRSELGLVDLKDIKSYISLEEQIGKYDSEWRDRNSNFDEKEVEEFNSQDYVDLLNKLRDENGAKGLNLSDKLVESSKIRAEDILKAEQIVSISDSEESKDLQEVISSTGYLNSFYVEFPRLGHFTAEELIESMFSSKESKDILLQPEYEDIGVSLVKMDVDGCPKTAIVQHLAGWESPSFSEESKKAIKARIDSLEENESDWEGLVSSSEFYFQNKNSIDRINQIIDDRKSKLKPIYEKISSNQDITKAEYIYISNEDITLSEEQSKLASEINLAIELFNSFN